MWERTKGTLLGRTCMSGCYLGFILKEIESYRRILRWDVIISDLELEFLMTILLAM